MCVLDISMDVLDVLLIENKPLKLRSRFLDRSVARHGFCLVSEPVANAGDGQDKTRAFRDRLDFLAQHRHIDMQAMCPGMCLSSPHFTQQHLPGENFAAVGDKDL